MSQFSTFPQYTPPQPAAPADEPTRQPDPAAADQADDHPATIPVHGSSVEAPIPSPQDELAVEIVANLQQAAHILRGELNTRLASLDMNDVRYAVLSIVRDAAAQGCSQSQLAERLQQSESSISTLVDRMRTSGLLYRLRSKTDRRKRYLTLTDKGKELLARVDGSYGRLATDLLCGLEDGRQKQFATALRTLVDSLGGHVTCKAAIDEPAQSSVPAA